MACPKKILIVIAKMGKGGAQSIVLDLANRLSDAGFVVDILLFYRTPQDQTYIEMLDRRITLVFMTKVPVAISSDFKGVGQRIVQYLKLPFLAVRWVMQGRLDAYDIVHSHLLGASFCSWFFDRLTRLMSRRSPFWIETFHADYSSIGAVQKRIFIFFWRHLDALVMELTRSDFRETVAILPKTFVHHIPFGISPPPAASVPVIDAFMERIGVTIGKPTLVSITRLNIREKRVDRLLEVIAAVKARHGGDFLFLLCGDGPDAELLRDYAHNLGIDNQVRFIGYVDDISLPLGAARAFLIAGIEDLVGIAGLQAAALGVPVVSWQVDSGWTGPRRFFWSDHSIDLVAEELNRLLQDNDYHRAAAARDQQVAREHFSVDAMVRGYVDLYNGLQRRQS